LSNNSFLTKTLNDLILTRRSFLKWSAALGGSAALVGGLKFGLEDVGAANERESQILSTCCYHNCGGRCILNAEVRDGVILRILPDQSAEDSFDNPRAIPCVAGRAIKRWVYAPERLKYPMKRVGTRGEGKFERISWEEALDTIASEMIRIKEEYGNDAFYCNYATGQLAGGIDMTYKDLGPMSRVFHLFGGYVNFYGTYSDACYSAVQPYITATDNNSDDDLVNSKLIVLFADNSLVTRAGGKGGGYHYLKAKEAGAKFIVVDPRQSATAVTLDADWVPINPGTDVAFIAALAYVMVEEDLHDKEFMATHSIGFDESNLPEGAPSNSSWMAYLKGDADGTPKTPEWAAPITGIPADRIIQLAHEMANTKPCAIIQGLGWQRRAYGEQPVRALPVLAAMTGNFGIKGGGTGMRYRINLGFAGGYFPAGINPIQKSIPVFMWPDYIERGKEMTSGPKDRIKGAEKLEANMKFMWNWAGNTLVNQHSDINRTKKLLEDDSKLEFIVVGDVMMTPSAKFADILLPETTHYEIEDVISGKGEGKTDFVLFNHKLIEPMYECKSILWIAEQVADRLGFGDEFRDGHETREDWLKDMVVAAQEGDEDFPTYEELKKAGLYKIIGQGSVIAAADFREVPESNPLGTETGKIEIYSPHLAAQNDPNEIPAIPKYIPEWEGVSDPLREIYPLMMVGHHAVQRIHSTYDNVDYLQEVHPQALWINSWDAADRGIKNGDEVKVFNERGVVYIPAKVTNRIRPGVTSVPQGAWYTPDEEGNDIRGSVNVLTKYHPTPYAKGNPQHTNLVQVEKA